ncbi:MAG: alpha-2-macroglobulin family protein [Bacteroidota bacterium]
MLLSIRLSLLLLFTAPAFFLASTLLDNNSTTVNWSSFMKGDYEEQWKAVDKALNEGLPKSALEMVEKIYDRAKKENIQPQIVKSIAYRVALMAVTNEEDEVILIRDLEKEIAAAEQPVKAVLNSMLAGLYWSYYQMNRWRIQDRTEVADTATADFRTWEPGRFFDTAKSLYLESIAPAELLQQKPVEAFEAILVTQSESGKYRPTLYDILAHRALEFFQNDQVDLPVPQQDFELTGIEALIPAADFIAHTFTSPNPRNTKFQALLIYQQLLRFHLQRGDTDAIVDLDLQRLGFGLAETQHEDKDTTYYIAVESLYKAHASSSISTLAGAALARYHFTHNDYVKALAFCDREIGRFTASRGASDCRALRSSILAKEMSLSVEQTTPPNAPILVSAGYRNVERVHFRIVKLLAEEDDESILQQTRDISQRQRLEDILRRGNVKQWSQDLPKQTDYKSHLVDLSAPELPLGVYMIFMSPREDFSFDDNAIAYTWLRVTRLSLENIEDNRGGQHFWVTDALEGQPLKSVQVQMFTRRWNSSDYGYERIAQGNARTDADGLFVLEPGRFRDGVSFRLSVGRDTLTVLNSYNAYERGRENTQRRTLFFTDRAIYRPGQTLYLKGIITEGNREKADYEVVKNTSTTVIFLDANHQKVHEVQLRSNEYGSFNTSFTVPSGVLTGMMYIRNETGSINVRVEEYKRPKFEAMFKPVEGEYRLNAVVKVTGEAKAYAGSNIDGATVNWRVQRQVRFPYWYWWWRPAPQGSAREIAHGTTTTDADGAFTLEFTALPDRSVDPKTQPVFTYSVTADVVDINGETHSASTSVSAGYTSVELSLGIAEVIDATKEQELRLNSRNLGGQPVATTGTLRIEQLTPPDRILRGRMLPVPDSWVLSMDEFKRAFPHDVYKDENIADNWEVRRTVIDTKFNTGADGTDSLILRDLAPGSYRITMSAKDPGGQDLLIRKTVTVYRPEDDVPSMLPEFFVGTKTMAEPGEEARFLYGSAYDGVSMLTRVDRHLSAAKEEWQTRDAGQRSFRYMVEEKDRGGFSVQIFFVKNYRLYQQTVAIAVPWSNKQLQVETATFRDKLKPGQEEEWRITIKGPQRDRIAAEMLASMYDASLDAIYAQDWSRFSWPSYGSWTRFSNYGFGGNSARMYIEDWNSILSGYSQYYDRLNLFLFDRYGRYYGRQMYKSKSEGGRNGDDGMVMESVSGMAMDAAPPPSPASMADGIGSNELLAKKDKGGLRDEEKETTGTGDASAGGLDAVKARTNFNETAFFYPDLMTDEQGNVVLRFTAPEALTRWKLRVYAHTPDLKTGYLEKTTVTQKELMVMPNMPRFLRNGDDISLMTKITNMSDTSLTGSVTLKIFDAVTMQPLDERFGLKDAVRSFTAEKGRSATAQWNVHVPDDVSAIVYRIVAKAGEFSDGEEMALPVLPNRMLVTETLPLNIRGGETKTFTFDKLLRSGGSTTLRQHQLTLEMTSQPAWYAVQALPYLIEYPYECSEQVFNRYYANSIAGHIAQSNPKIKRVFDQWKNTDALLSNLQKNQDLKMLLLEETPWVLQGKDESERKKRIALLFDLNTMGNNLETAMRKLEKAQASNGGWPWFPGMPENRYITQYIVAGFGHLSALGVNVSDERVNRMLRRAVEFMDARMNEDYLDLKAHERSFDPKKDYLNHLAVQYLYARSYFLKQDIPDKYDEAVNFWREQSRKWWARRGHMMQGQIALALHRLGEKDVPQAVVRSLKERSLQNDEMGMYWKYERGWYWYQAPIETQALMVEVFDEVAGDMKSVEELKIWLLKQKQVQDWGSTVATAEVCYALLRRGSDLLASDKLVEVTMGGEKIDPVAMGAKVEAGTGYYRVDWRGSDIRPEQGTIVAKKADQGIAWGAVYWQYFEQLDKITPAKTPLQIEKTLYLQRNTEKGQVLEPITEKNKLHVGDVVKVRVTIRIDRDMEYVHLKDMRGSGLDLISQLSGYHWKGGLGYYEAPKDASVNFFFHWLPKGVHVFEYPLRVSHAGRFSNGISAIQCMYAPEFAAHTAGIIVTVE